MQWDPIYSIVKPALKAIKTGTQSQFKVSSKGHIGLNTIFMQFYKGNNRFYWVIVSIWNLIYGKGISNLKWMWNIFLQMAEKWFAHKDPETCMWVRNILRLFWKLGYLKFQLLIYSEFEFQLLINSEFLHVHTVRLCSEFGKYLFYRGIS